MVWYYIVEERSIFFLFRVVLERILFLFKNVFFVSLEIFVSNYFGVIYSIRSYFWCIDTGWEE